METELEGKKEEASLGPGQIKRSITSMPMAPYWEGLIANSKHVTFRTARWKGPIDAERGKTVWTITPLSVIETGKKLMVAVRSFQIDRMGSRVPRTDKFEGEIHVKLGSYVDVVRQIAYKKSIPVKSSHIEYV